jgi:hypothetical protein
MPKRLRRMAREEEKDEINFSFHLLEVSKKKKEDFVLVERRKNRHGYRV